MTSFWHHRSKVVLTTERKFIGEQQKQSNYENMTNGERLKNNGYKIDEVSDQFSPRPPQAEQNPIISAWSYEDLTEKLRNDFLAVRTEKHMLSLNKEVVKFPPLKRFWPRVDRLDCEGTFRCMWNHLCHKIILHVTKKCQLNYHRMCLQNFCCF